jgi:hypothetical protein
MRTGVRAGTLMLGLIALSACASDVPPVPAPPRGPTVSSLASMTESALADAAKRTGLKRADLKVLSVEAVIWSDGSLGCPEPGMQYTQALVPGYRVRIQAGTQVLDYHAGRSGQPVYCPADRAQPPAPDPRI